jgi:hypothetical protein
MSKKPARKPGRPLGTDTGVFSCTDNRVSVRFVEGARHQEVTFLFSTARQANDALVTLQCSLAETEPTAQQLRECYSVEHLLAYLREYLPQANLDGATWNTIVRVSAAGLESRSPTGEWKPLQVENMTTQMLDWKPIRSENVELSHHAASLYRRFQLEPGQVWETTANVFSHDLPAQLLGSDD